MGKYSLAYNRVVDDYYNPTERKYDFEEGYVEGKKLDSTVGDEYLDIFNLIRMINKKNIRNVLELRVKFLNNNDSLVQELSNVVATIDNGIDFDAFSGRNYVFLTTKYLCFNNFENYIDKSELDKLGSSASTSETTIIIDTHFEKFYFIRTTKEILSQSQSTTVDAYTIKGNDVEKSRTNVNGGVTLSENNDEEIQKLLSSLELNSDSPKLL